MQLTVVHALGEDVYPGMAAFGIEEGVLLVYADSTLRQALKAYNRDIWASATYGEVP